LRENSLPPKGGKGVGEMGSRGEREMGRQGVGEKNIYHRSFSIDFFSSFNDNYQMTNDKWKINFPFSLSPLLPFSPTPLLPFYFSSCGGKFQSNVK